MPPLGRQPLSRAAKTMVRPPVNGQTRPSRRGIGYVPGARSPDQAVRGDW